MTAGILEKLFNKTIMLRPAADGVLEPVDITGNNNPIYTGVDIDGNPHARRIIQSRVYNVRRIKGINKICIQRFNSPELVDVYGDSPSMTEYELAGLLEMSYQKGMKDTSGMGNVNPGLARTLKIIMVLSGIAAILEIIKFIQK